MIRAHQRLVFCGLVMISSTAAAQQPATRFEYGSPDELKGVTKVYVYTGPQLEVRNNIVNAIQKSLKNIVITDRPENAEVHLVFAADASTFYAGTWRNSTTTDSGTINGRSQTYGNTTTAQGTYSGQSTTSTSSTPIYRTVVTGVGFVGKLVGKDTVRLLLDFKDSRSTIWERRPSTNFAKAFIKAYE